MTCAVASNRYLAKAAMMLRKHFVSKHTMLLRSNICSENYYLHHTLKAL